MESEKFSPPVVPFDLDLDLELADALEKAWNANEEASQLLDREQEVLLAWSEAGNILISLSEAGYKPNLDEGSDLLPDVDPTPLYPLSDWLVTVQRLSMVMERRNSCLSNSLTFLTRLEGHYSKGLRGAIDDKQARREVERRCVGSMRKFLIRLRTLRDPIQPGAIKKKPEPKDREFTNEEKAIVLLSRNPDMSVNEIAEKVGCDPSLLYSAKKCPKFTACRKALKAGPSLPRGSKSKDGHVEAWYGEVDE